MKGSGKWEPENLIQMVVQWLESGTENLELRGNNGAG